ncbi:MAG TPA: outer membrane beta-barrel protein [Bradyrhizobium sp.]|nr:outer membrane beta-barrel protein [Bradyrhizobium sp.]
MKKILQGVVVLITLGVGAPAFAADLPPAPVYKTPVMTPAYYDWSGFYVGLNGGGGSSHKCWDNVNVDGVPTVPSIREGCHDATGGLAGGQIGFRWQSGGWVFGVEAQGDWAALRGSNASIPVAVLPTVPLLTNQTKIDAIGLFTGQVGYAWNSVLWYVKGGAALTDDRYNGLITGTNTLIDTARETRWGGAVGTGIEVAFAPNWSVGFEYDHLFMGSRNNTFTFDGQGGLSRIDRISQDVDMGTVRVNYRWGGPVIAKY